VFMRCVALFFFFSSRRRHTRSKRDWSSDVCSSDLTELFKRSVGDTTDIVQKEMYSFTDKGERDITLKPEGTAGVVRAFIENKLYADTQPTKLFYITPCFRYERPQAGRQRQFHQFGIEALGSDKPSLDAEVIA